MPLEDAVADTTRPATHGTVQCSCGAVFSYLIDEPGNENQE